MQPISDRDFVITISLSCIAVAKLRIYYETAKNILIFYEFNITSYNFNFFWLFFRGLGN